MLHTRTDDKNLNLSNTKVFRFHKTFKQISSLEKIWNPYSMNKYDNEENNNIKLGKDS